MTRPTHAIVAALGATLLALPSAMAGKPSPAQQAQDAGEGRRHADLELFETPAFSIYLPAGWDLDVKRPGKDPKLGTWSGGSANRNARVFVRVGHLRDEDMRSLWLRYAEESLGKNVGHVHVQTYWEKAANSVTGVSFGTVYGVGRRNTTAQLYKYGVIAVRNLLRGRMIYVALGGTEDAWRAVARHMPMILRSVNLR